MGVLLRDTRSATVENCTFAGNHHTGIRVELGDAVRIAGNIVRGTVAGSGIHVLSARRSTFEANQVYDAGQDGIKLEDGPVLDNRFVANYLSDAVRDGLDGAIQPPDCETIRDNLFAGNIAFDNGFHGSVPTAAARPPTAPARRCVP